MVVPAHGACSSDVGGTRSSRYELFSQFQSALVEVSGLAQAISNSTAAACDQARTGIREASPKAIDHAFAILSQGAHSELLEVRPALAADPGKAPTGPAAPAARRRHRLIVGAATAASPGAAERIAALVGAGAQVRTAGWIPVRVAVTDRQTVAVALEYRTESGYLLIERRTELARRATRLMEHWWERAQPFSQPFSQPQAGSPPRKAPPSPGPPAGTEAAIMEGLAQGLTDECVARRVGVTPRTVRRYVAAMSERYGATSRMQLGVMIGLSRRPAWYAEPTAPLGERVRTPGLG